MSKIVSVHSFRGGTGKSNVTANVATMVALHGKRVGIVDTDIQSPGIHILFGLDDRQVTRALNDYLYGQCRIEDCAYHVTPPEVLAAGGRVYGPGGAAHRLGLNPTTLYGKMRKHGINRTGADWT